MAQYKSHFCWIKTSSKQRILDKFKKNIHIKNTKIKIGFMPNLQLQFFIILSADSCL